MVTLSPDGKLQHMHYDGDKWSKWEDMGMRAHSVLSIIVLENQVFIFAVSNDGRLVS